GTDLGSCLGSGLERPCGSPPTGVRVEGMGPSRSWGVAATGSRRSSQGSGERRAVAGEAERRAPLPCRSDEEAGVGLISSELLCILLALGCDRRSPLLAGLALVVVTAERPEIRLRGIVAGPPVVGVGGLGRAPLVVLDPRAAVLVAPQYPCAELRPVGRQPAAPVRTPPARHQNSTVRVLRAVGGPKRCALRGSTRGRPSACSTRDGPSRWSTRDRAG